MSVLEALDVESGAVPTCYRDMYTAYEMLPAELRVKLKYEQTLGANLLPAVSLQSIVGK